MPEPHPAEIRLAALRALLLALLEEPPGPVSIEDPYGIARALVDGADIRDIGAVLGSTRDDAVAAVLKLADGTVRS